MPHSEPLIDRMIKEAVQYLLDARTQALTVAALSQRTGVDLAVLHTLFADDHALSEAVGNYVAIQLTDAMSRAVAAAPCGDNRAALIALGAAHVAWARKNRELYGVVSARLLMTDGGSWAFHRYDSSFVPLVRQFLGETHGQTTRRAAMARSFIFGITALALEERLDVWLRPDSSIDHEMMATISDFVDMLLSWVPRQH